MWSGSLVDDVACVLGLLVDDEALMMLVWFVVQMLADGRVCASRPVAVLAVDLTHSVAHACALCRAAARGRGGCCLRITDYGAVLTAWAHSSALGTTAQQLGALQHSRSLRGLCSQKTQ